VPSRTDHPDRTAKYASPFLDGNRLDALADILDAMAYWNAAQAILCDSRRHPGDMLDADHLDAKAN
jgi:hypothetical protein